MVMSRTIGTYLAELLVANEIDTVFGIPGVHNLELYRGIAANRVRVLRPTATRAAAAVLPRAL